MMESELQRQRVLQRGEAEERGDRKDQPAPHQPAAAARGGGGTADGDQTLTYVRTITADVQPCEPDPCGEQRTPGCTAAVWTL